MNENLKEKIMGEEGYAIVLAILMFAILMIAGVLSSNMTITDLGAVRNVIISSQNASAADSAAMMAVQFLENQKDSTELDPATSAWAWLNSEGEIPAGADENSSSYNGFWGDKDLSGNALSASLNKISPRFSKEGGKLRYRVIGWNATRGASLGGYSNTLKECVVRGVYYSPTSGIYSVEMGYKKRF